MTPGSGIEIWSRTFVADNVLGFAERLDFERLLQKLRLSLLVAPLLVLVASGPRAIGVALWILLAVSVSFSVVELMLRYRPEWLLDSQLVYRVVDCGVVYFILAEYHAFLRNAYYDAAYVLCVAAASATHGRRGGWAIAALAGLAVLVGRLQLIATGAVIYDTRHLIDPVVYTMLFVAM